MGGQQAWVTWVARDTDVANAVTLANSIRLTRTSRQICSIISGNLSKSQSDLLRKTFDSTFLLDTNVVSAGIKEIFQGKIFAFSLQMFEKCLYVDTTTMFLENCDKLFEVDNLYQAFDDAGKLFLFVPNMALCEHLGKMDTNLQNMDAFLDHLYGWLKNNTYDQFGEPLNFMKERITAVISSRTGRILSNGLSHPAVVQITDVLADEQKMVHQMTSLLNDVNVGLTEKARANCDLQKAIISKWLDLRKNSADSLSMSSEVNEAKLLDINIKQPKNEPIAIVGMSCRFPGANNLDEFWNLLHAGKEGIQTPPPFRWKKSQTIFGSTKERQTNAGFLSVPVDEFDAKFFGISSKDATFMDPQTRLLHEIAWESLENAGIDPLKLKNSHTGIFTGSWMNDYKDIVQTSAERDFFRTYMGNSIGTAAARLSLLLGSTGPSIATESGCSSGIVAVDMAVKSLRSGETNLALAGGVNLLLHPFQTYFMEFVISPNGRCKTFDADADGFGRAEGCAVLVLKRLSDSLRDDDNIWAVIRGSAISQEGISRCLGTPTVQCEALAMQLAMKDAGVKPEQISFVETHGTGTCVGDPLEVAAIAKAYHSKARVEPLIIGSVKTNTGHTESCSGLAGIIKTILAMKNELIPKHLNLVNVNPEINLDHIPAKIPTENIIWSKTKNQPRIAGISSFGITGTDGHLILEEPPIHSKVGLYIGLERPLHILKISAKSKQALEDLAKGFKNMLETPNLDESFANIAHIGNVGRASFGNRLFFTARNCKEAVSAIESGKMYQNIDEVPKEPRKLCFLFTGQGSQYAGMAKELYAHSPVFRLHFNECERLLVDNYEISISNVLWDSETDGKQIGRTLCSQTSIFCVQYCLLKLWESWGITPDYVLGHSLGEFCAAVAAGVLGFEDALMLVAERSRLIDSLPFGSMLVIKSDIKTVSNLIEIENLEIDIAADNYAEQTVVSGNPKMINAMKNICEAKSLKTVVLEATHAFHSRYMNPILEEYRQIAKSVIPQASNGCHYISAVEGKLLERPHMEIDADYWVRHTRNLVKFKEAGYALNQLDCQDFLEIGPQPVLSAFVMQNTKEKVVTCYPSLRRNKEDWETILSTMGNLYLQGFPVNWEGFDKPYARKKVPALLPFHPFYRKPFWVDCADVSLSPIHPFIGSPFKNASSVSIFQSTLNLKTAPWLRDHCVGNRIILPGAVFAEICLAAGYCVENSLHDFVDMPQRPVAIENFSIDAPMELTEGGNSRIQVVVSLESPQKDKQQGFEVKVFRQSFSDGNDSDTGKWLQHCSAVYNPIPETKTILAMHEPDEARRFYETNQKVSTEVFYKRGDGAGLRFGENFRCIRNYTGEMKENKKDHIIAEVVIPTEKNVYVLHPILIDSMLQSIILSQSRSINDMLLLPVQIGKIVWLRSMANENKHIYLKTCWDEEELCHVFALDQDFRPLAYLAGVELIETTLKTFESVLVQQTRDLPDSWEEIWKPNAGPLENRAILVPVHTVFEDPELQSPLQTASEADLEIISKTNRLIYLYAADALAKLGGIPEVGSTFTVPEYCKNLAILPAHHQLIHFYFKMIQEETGALEFSKIEHTWKVVKNNITIESQKNHIQSIFRELGSNPRTSKVLKIYEAIGSQLHDILRGSKTALQILFPTESSKEDISAEVFYNNHPEAEAWKSQIILVLKTLFTKLRSKNVDQPNSILRVLEVGAGTGYTTEDTINAIKLAWGQKFEYFFTDISASFFTKAEKKFGRHGNNIYFSTFNLEESPLEQGIPLEYFDLIISQEVVHATRNLEEAVGNMRKTLKPGGSICLVETITEDRAITFVFGLLEGYWRFSDYHWRPEHACVDKMKWHQILLKTGFSKVQNVNSSSGSFGLFLAEAGNHFHWKNLGSVSDKQWLFIGDSVNLPHILQERGLNNLKIALTNSGNGPVADTAHYLIDAESDQSTVIWDILDSQKSLHGIIYGLGLSEQVTNQKQLTWPFLHIAKKLVEMQKPPRLYIFTKGIRSVSDSQHACDPSASSLIGMAKSLKNEYPDLFVRAVDLDAKGSIEENVTQVIYELAMHKLDHEKHLIQTAYRQNTRYFPKFCATRIKLDELQLPAGSKRYRLLLPASRQINDLKFDMLEEELLAPDQVEVVVKAYSLNFRDVLAILKPTKEFEEINGVGIDFSGVITKVGENVSPKKFRIGDRVCGAHAKAKQLHSHVIIEAKKILKFPDRFSFSEASAIPVAFATSLYCLNDVAKLKKNEKVLIHTASGGVGLAAIQVARGIGADIYATAGSPRKREYLRRLGIKHVFHSRDTSYKENILRATGGVGVDVVLNSITGPGFKEATLEVCADKARFVEMSKLSVWTTDEVKKRRADVIYNLVDLRDDVDYEGLFGLKKHLDKILPIPCTRFDVHLIRQAFQYFLKAKHIGKVVVRMLEPDTREQGKQISLQMFNSKATYIITGGMGGIGFEVCKWMLDRGARNIVLIGRNPPEKQIAECISKLNSSKSDVNVVTKLGDVGNFKQCKIILEQVVREYPAKPIRGIQHCAGVLADNLYADMTCQSLEAPFVPKIYGTWNLHNLTKTFPLDHFVFYSTQSSLFGTPSQANHAAANSFEDAFAHYRNAMGLPATVINWGQWAQVGCARDASLPGIQAVSVRRMLYGLETALRSHKLQVALGDFESLQVCSIGLPIMKHYLDDKLFQTLDKNRRNHQIALKADQFWREIDEATEKSEKVEVVIDYVKRVLRSSLRMDEDETINENADMHELGVDSLMLIELKNSIQGFLGSRLTISASMLKDCKTICDISNVIVNKLCDEEDEAVKAPALSPEELTALLESDCKLDETIHLTSTSPVSPENIKTVLITGVTGQLGPYILSWLTSKSTKSTEKIICVIRTKKEACPTERLASVLRNMGLLQTVDMSRIDCVRGDVMLPNFGLDETFYNALSVSVEAVFHLAAKSNHIEQYRKCNKGNNDVRSVNVGGTLNVLKFAATGITKRMFYSSGLVCVFGGNEDKTLCDEWPEEFQGATIADHKVSGYIASKYVCEMLLKQANQRGIPCKVFRFPWILGDSNDGQINYVNNHYILRFLSYLKLKSIPDTPIPALVLPVDTCADIALQVFFNEEAPDEVYNITHPKPQLEVEFKEVASKDFGIELEMVDWKSSEFVSKLYASDMPLEALRELYEDVDRGIALANSDAFQAFRGYLENPDLFFVNKKLKKYVPQYNKNIASTMEIISKNIAFVKNNGVFDKFGI